MTTYKVHNYDPKIGSVEMKTAQGAQTYSLGAPETPVEVLEAVYASKPESFKYLVPNANCPLSVLKAFASSPDARNSDLIYQVTEHPNTNFDVLQTLIQNNYNSTSIVYSVLQNPNLTDENLETFWEFLKGTPAYADVRADHILVMFVERARSPITPWKIAFIDYPENHTIRDIALENRNQFNMLSLKSFYIDYLDLADEINMNDLDSVPLEWLETLVDAFRAKEV